MKTRFVIPMAMLAVIMLLPSCATLFSSRRTGVSVYTQQPVMLTHNDSTYYSKPSERPIKGNVVKFNPRRSEDPLKFSLHNETDTVELMYLAQNNPAIYLNLLMLNPVGYAIDLGNNKCHTYPAHINLTEKELPSYSGTSPIYEPNSSEMDRKGMLTLNIGFPIYNFMRSSVDRTTLHAHGSNSRETFSFGGISLGADYYYHHNRFINLTAGITTHGDRNISSGYRDEDYKWHNYPWRERTSGQSVFVGLTHNHRWQLFSVGYGIGYDLNWWRYRVDYSQEIIKYATSDYIQYTRPIWDKYRYKSYASYQQIERHHRLGLRTQLHFTPSEKFYAGVDCHYPVWNIGSSNYNNPAGYLISITLGWKIRLKGGK